MQKHIGGSLEIKMPNILSIVFFFYHPPKKKGSGWVIDGIVARKQKRLPVVAPGINDQETLLHGGYSSWGWYEIILCVF